MLQKTVHLDGFFGKMKVGRACDTCAMEEKCLQFFDGETGEKRSI